MLESFILIVIWYFLKWKGFYDGQRLKKRPDIFLRFVFFSFYFLIFLLKRLNKNIIKINE